MSDINDLEDVTNSTQFSTERKDARGTKQGQFVTRVPGKDNFIGYKRRRPRKSQIKATLPKLKFMGEECEDK